MISLWALLKESDVEAYAAGLMLPSYLSHLQLEAFGFAAQVENCDGQEPLVLTYLGDGRLEHYSLDPADHALPMIRFVCPTLDAAKIRLPQDDASWHWTTPEDVGGPMRIYFSPTSRSLMSRRGLPPSQDAYVSVSQGHVFLGRPVVEAYLQAWLSWLGVDDTADFDFGTPSGEIEFTAGTVGGQMALCEREMAEDLMYYAGLDRPLARVGELVRLDMDSGIEDQSGIYDDGIYINLLRRAEPAIEPAKSPASRAPTPEPRGGDT